MTIPPLTGIDIGSPRRPGATRLSPRDITVVAGGEDIWGTQDEFHFACVPVTGDFELSARLTGLTMADVYTKAGLMLRASLAAGAEHVFLLAFGDNQPRNQNNGGLEFQSRAVPVGPCTGIYPPQPLSQPPDFPADYPQVWLQLIRAGDQFTGRFSQDGMHWKTYCVHQQALPRTAYLGLAVTSHNANRTVEGGFSELSFRGEVSQPPQSA